MAKRGRKPSPEKLEGYYFYEREEQAVLDYLHSDSQAEKEQIYNDILKPAFEKMIESIIRRYKLYIPAEDYDDTFNDTLSNLMTKLGKFKPGKYKAYSYYGTVCKNYLIGRIQNYNKAVQRNPSYDPVIEEFTDNIRYSDADTDGSSVASETVQRLIDRLGEMTDDPQTFDLKENEVKLGKALRNLLENWEYVLTTDKSNKLNKNAILLFLRNSTGLDTPGIRNNMKKFKKEFLIIKDYIIN